VPDVKKLGVERKEDVTMKLKVFRVKQLGMYALALCGFLLMQGCATSHCAIEWLKWPYDSAEDQMDVMPVTEYPVETVEPVDTVLLPPELIVVEPVVETEDVIVLTPPEPKVYTVQKGDTLSGIAVMYGTSWKRLNEFNSLSNPHKLFPGQEILIPAELEVVADPVRFSTPKTSSSGTSRSSGKSIKQGKTYVIQKGDTLSGIASRSGLTVSELKAANALTGNQIVAGKSLTIPKKDDVSIHVISEPTPETTEEKAPAAEAADLAPELAPIVDEVSAPVETDSAAPVYEHVLYPGETIEDVARQYGSSQTEILWLNDITDPSTLKPGTKLMVPIPE
jgi:LysM repeat protein